MSKNSQFTGDFTSIGHKANYLALPLVKLLHSAVVASRLITRTQAHPYTAPSQRASGIRSAVAGTAQSVSVSGWRCAAPAEIVYCFKLLLASAAQTADSWLSQRFKRGAGCRVRVFGLVANQIAGQSFHLQSALPNPSTRTSLRVNRFLAFSCFPLISGCLVFRSSCS